MFELTYWFYRVGIESILQDTNPVKAARSTAQLSRGTCPQMEPRAPRRVRP
jgi:hypothetical protein